MAPIPRRTMLRTGVTAASALVAAGAHADAVHAAPPFPSTALARQALELAEQHEPPVVLNHSLRSYLFATVLARRDGLRPGKDYDDELLFLICVLHDLGLTEVANGDQRFEVDGADFAARFLEQNKAPSHWIDTAWDAIALHSSPTLVASPVFARRRPPEVGLSVNGIGVDILGGPDQLPPGVADEVLARYPRLGGARAVTDIGVAQAIANPRKALPLTFIGEVVHQRNPSAPYTTWDELIDANGWGD